MKRIFELGCVAALALPALAASAASSPDQVFDDYQAAVHRGDMGAVRALIAPDVERSDFIGCRPEMDNRTCLETYLSVTVVQPKAQLTVVRRKTTGETVSVDLEVRSPLYTKAGVERILGTDVVKVHEGLIQAFKFVPDFHDEQTAVFFGSLGIGPRAAPAAAKP